MAEQLKVVEGTALTAQQKKDLLNRLARIEGQLRGVQKLIALAAEPADCEAVAQQMAAARKALDRSFVQLLTALARLAVDLLLILMRQVFGVALAFVHLRLLAVINAPAAGTAPRLRG